MANNSRKMAFSQRHLLPFFLMIISFPVFGQKLSKYYKSSLQSNGKLYFIYPHKGFKGSEGNGKLEYDITYLSSNDSAVLNFSYYGQPKQKIDSIIFVDDGMRISSLATKIFVEPEKHEWHYRYSAKFNFFNLKELYSKENKPEILLKTQNNLIKLQINHRTWKRQSSIIKRIITLINYNK